MKNYKALLILTILIIATNCEEDSLSFLSTNTTDVQDYSDEKESQLMQILEETVKEYEKHLDMFIKFKNEQTAISDNLIPRNLVQKCSKCWQTPKANLCFCVKNKDCCSGLCLSNKCFDR
jgi:hypothetical protein